jgi:hypothetical protein
VRLLLLEGANSIGGTKIYLEVGMRHADRIDPPSSVNKP